MDAPRPIRSIAIVGRGTPSWPTVGAGEATIPPTLARPQRIEIDPVDLTRTTIATSKPAIGR